MKRILIVGALAGVITVFAVAALLVLGVAGYTIARAQEQPTPAAPSGSYGQGMMGGYGRGMMGRGGGFGPGMMGRWSGTYGPMHEYMLEAFAEVLDLTPDEIQTRIEAGETMWQIAQSEGLSDEEIQALMLDGRQAALEQMVADGVITQEQADWMIERMEQMQESGFGPGSCLGQGGGRRGGRWNR